MRRELARGVTVAVRAGIERSASAASTPSLSATAARVDHRAAARVELHHRQVFRAARLHADRAVGVGGRMDGQRFLAAPDPR
jgi:hypothetical protein